MKLMILDGNSVINRAYFGVRPLTTRDGLYTHAIYGFLNILERMEKEEQPDAVCVAFDLHGPTFRHLKYDGYKATRHGMPEELAMQMPVMKDVLRAMNIPIYECQGWEADDVIGTVGKICSNNGWECVVVTGDRDSLQLIDQNVHVKLVISKPGQTVATLYDEEKFRAEYGFEPKRLIDLKALMGDSSDNIPGVAGVGPKTATELLLKFGTLDGVYEHLSDASIRPKLREKLEAGKENAYLSYELATIVPEAPIDFEPKDAIIMPYNRPALYALFQRLEFVRLIDKYGLRGAELEQPKVEKKTSVLPRREELPEAGAPCAVYLAGDGSLGIAWEQGVCTLTPMEAQMLGDGLANRGNCVCHDMKATMHRLDELNLHYGTFGFDTALAAYDLNPSQSDYPVSKLATNFLGVSVEDSDAAACAEALWNLRPVLETELEEQGMKKLYTEIELPLCPVLYRMEKLGIDIDRAQLEQFGQMLSQRIAGCEALIYSYSGGPFNINSTKQLGELLFEKLGLPPVKKTKTGYSTNADVLEKLAPEAPIVSDILEYRQLTKLKSTYADGLLTCIAGDGRIHSTFNQTITATGRISSTEPNLQNIPIRTELGRLLRKVFVPQNGFVFMDADYSQIELRVLAHFSGDKALINAYREQSDIHRITASQVFHVPFDEVTDLQRRNAKAVNFGIVYGISSFGLSQGLSITRKEAEGYINRYFETYPGIKAFLDGAVAEAKEKGYVTTLFGRRRPVPELKSSNFMQRSFGERVAMNSPIQGTAADIIKFAMLGVDRRLRRENMRSRLILQVHDELLIETAVEEEDRVRQILTEEMMHAADLAVELVIDLHTGKNWYEAK